MALDHESQQRLLAGAASSTARADRWTPPSPAQLQEVFPNLQILELIGQGGMGAVYKARQTHLDRVVAVKLLAPHLTTQAAFAERFQREAKLLARLSHSHIVALYDVGEAGPWRYLVLEYIEGATLREVLTTGPFTAAAALTLTPQLCEALAYAHGQGIIHRDLKPENILIDASGKGHIADFGLATLRGDDSEKSITQSGDVLGTAAYMAPEQRSGASGIDHRADLYALGVIVYEMLTGHLPLGRFEVPSYQGRLDVRIDSVVLQALERTPELRWQSAEDMRRAVDALAPRAPGSLPRGSSRRRVLVLGAAMLAVGVALGVLIPVLLWGGAAGPTARGPGSVITATPLVPAAAMPLAGVAGSLATRQGVPETVVPQAMVPSPVLPQSSGPARAAPAVSATPTLSAIPAIPAIRAIRAIPAIRAIRAIPAIPELPAISTAATVMAAPPVVSGAPAPVASVATATPAAILPGHHLVVHGEGDLIVIAKPGVLDMDDLTAESGSGFQVFQNGDQVLELNLVVSQAHAHLTIPQGWLDAVRFDGGGRLVLRGCTGAHLSVVHTGSGTLELEQLAVSSLSLDDQSVFLTRLSGQVQDATLHLAPGPGGVAVSQKAAGSKSIGYCDASHLVFSQLTATVNGGACLRLQGHAGNVVATLGTGYIDAAGLSVAKADISVTGSGQAVFGDLAALDVSCTGSGTVRWSGNPVLGHVTTSP